MTMLDTAGNVKPLVERLRQAAQDGREIITVWDHDPYLYDEAADEIERLRAALQEITEMWDGGWTSSVHMHDVARKALELTPGRKTG